MKVLKWNQAGEFHRETVGDGSARRCVHRLVSGSQADSRWAPICQKCMSISFMSGYRGRRRSMIVDRRSASFSRSSMQNRRIRSTKSPFRREYRYPYALKPRTKKLSHAGKQPTVPSRKAVFSLLSLVEFLHS